MEDITSEMLGGSTDDWDYHPETTTQSALSMAEIEAENKKLDEVISTGKTQDPDSIPEYHDRIHCYNPTQITEEDADKFLAANEIGFNELDRSMEIAAIRHLRLTQDQINEIMAHPAMNILSKMKPESVTLKLLEKLLAQKE